jgi:integrase
MVLFGAGLRRGEVAKLNLADLDQSKGKLTIIGKGRREPETIMLAPRTLRTLKAWY